MAESAAATPTLRRHNSIPTSVTLPRKLSLPHRTTSLDAPLSHGATLDLELVSFSIKSPSSFSYTSLRDVLPSPNAAVNSPTASSAAIITDISIRNRLVKHAAWAYLQPMSASPSSSSSSSPLTSSAASPPVSPSSSAAFSPVSPESFTEYSTLLRAKLAHHNAPWSLFQ